MISGNVKAGLLDPRGEKRGATTSGSPRLMAVQREIIDARDPRDDSDPFGATA